ncbi:MAG: leucyl aminopeptidase [Dehalococcoidales bacterium]|nr:leucyl aminopeptidase [Dehalococcoidales bacterium]
MELNVIQGDITGSKSDAIILGYCEDSPRLGENLSKVDKALDGLVSQLVQQREIKGQFKENTYIYSLGKIPCRKIAIMGLGKKADLTADRIRVALAEVCRGLRQKGVKEGVYIACEGNFGPDPEITGQAIAEGVLLGTYAFRKYITGPAEYNGIGQLDIIDPSTSVVESLKRGCSKGKVIAGATNLARDMVNEPANYMNPARIEEIARHLAQDRGLEIEVLEREKMRELGMGGMLGVSQGSQQPPKFIVLKYNAAAGSEPDIAMIGKGITFDSGGISLKPSENMGEMKSDMSGAAAVLGAINAVAQLQPHINVAAIIPATENMPSGTAMRPGDIITMMNGKTVEIISTDAEGRLILADGLCYAGKLKARRMVDVATLTGSCHMALGDIYSGIFGNDQGLINRTIALGEQAGELMWQLPMNDEYKEQNKSPVADIKNTGGRYAGAITAALFLKEFVESIPWIHLDIAGTAVFDKDKGYNVKGATGVAVRTLINMALSINER